MYKLMKEMRDENLRLKQKILKLTNTEQSQNKT